MMSNDISDVSVVICTRNNKTNIKRVVQTIIDEKPGEIIVVDGNSTDGTREIVEKMDVKVIEDPGKGLALARQISLKYVSGRFVLFVGDDNIIKKGSIYDLKKYVLEHDWIGGAFLTRVYNYHNSYLSYCANWRWKVRFFEGERDVIGTPYMFYTELIKEVGFDENCSVSDDSDMQKRLKELSPKKYGYSNICCYEIGKIGYRDIVSRYLMYGKSDAEYWRKYSGDWTIIRKMKSILHPITDELIKPLKSIKPFSMKLYVLLFFVFITEVRYIGWLKEVKRYR